MIEADLSSGTQREVEVRMLDALLRIEARLNATHQVLLDIEKWHATEGEGITRAATSLADDMSVIAKLARSIKIPTWLHGRAR
jgi:hypothetical protein